MKSLIGVTGTPSSGKSSFARALSKKTGFKCIEINSVVKKKRLYTLDGKEKVADLKALEKELRRETTHKNTILVGHLSQELGLPYNSIIVIRAKINMLDKRMKERKYNLEKIKENLVCEALDYCGSIARKRFHNVFEVESDAEKKQIANLILNEGNGLEKFRKEKNKMQEFKVFIKKNKNYGF